VKSLFADTSGLGDEAGEIVTKLATRLFIYHPLDVGGATWSTREELIARIKGLLPVQESHHCFHTVLLPADERALRNLVAAIQTEIVDTLAHESYEAVAIKLQQLNPLNAVGSTFVLHLVNDVKRAVNESFRTMKDDALSQINCDRFGAASRQLDKLSLAAAALPPGRRPRVPSRWTR